MATQCPSRQPGIALFFMAIFAAARAFFFSVAALAEAVKGILGFRRFGVLVVAGDTGAGGDTHVMAGVTVGNDALVA